MANKDFMASFLQSFTQSRQAKKDREAQDELKKFQIKMFKKQLDDEDQKQAALDKIYGMMGNSGEQGPQQPKSILDLLADPQGQQLLMQSGTMSGKDIISSKSQATPFDISQLPPGMALKGVKITDKGVPMYDFEMPEAGKEAKDATGRNVITYDKQGNPMSSRPISPEELSLTPAQKAIDTKFAEEYTQFQTAGGYTDVQKGIGQLNEALKALASSNNLSGPIVGGTPDSVLKFTNPDAIAVREKVEEVVQKNLRLVLGAQFTEKEGERLIARSYNPNLSEAENTQRLSRLITQIQGAAQAKMAAIKYYEENGTLQGFQGKVPNMGDFNPDSGVITLTPDDEALVNKYLKP